MEPSLGKKAEISVVLGVFTAFAIIGVVTVAFAVEDFARARSSLSWTPVEGVILSGGGDENAASASIRYAYSVDGRTYESQRLRFFTARFSGRMRTDFEAGQIVAVYVSPEDPSVSVLRPGGAGAAFAALVILGAAMVFIGLGGVFRTLTASALELIEAEAAYDRP
ncbi:MAG: DUF3592 domain-containing protein [Parvularculaceae bacterium]